ncbi:MAG: hypothetical protein ACU0CO_05890 [Shimia sp.]
MYRPVLIMSAFLLVTVSLIFFQPKRDPGVDVATAERAALQPVERVATAPPAPAPAISVESAVPTPDTAAPEVEIVTRAVVPTLEEDVAPEPETQAVVAAPTIQRGADGTARPSLLTLAPADRARLIAPSPAPSDPAPSTPAAAPAPETGQIATIVGGTARPSALVVRPPAIGDTALQERLAATPTRAVHTVRIGDSLTTLALRYYGDAEARIYILEANRRLLGEDGRATEGMLLRIPDISNL